jgi:hypothetical protein
MLRAYKIPPLALFVTVLLLAGGELAAGTSLAFVSMMMVALVSIGLTYNQVGGLGTFSGIMFIAFAMRNIVISQFAKVLLFEPADKNLEAPQLTIAVYAVFYLFAMVGSYLFGNFRFKLPRPIEPTTQSRLGLLYAIALPLGAIGVVLTAVYGAAYQSDENIQYGPQHALGIALSPLLLFAVVLAVELRLRKTKGRHSFGVLAFIPWLGATFIGFSDSVRTALLLPTVVYFVACHLRGYRFRLRHYALGIVGLASFTFFLSPFLLYARGFTANQRFTDRIQITLDILRTVHNPRILETAVEAQVERTNAEREQYYDAPGTFTLSRFSLIRADSNVIYATANGFHYGLIPTEIDLLRSIPSFLYKNKPRYEGGQDYIGRISGISGDASGVTAPAISAVGDSYGAFGWAGVVLFPFLCFPLFFSVYESIFDFARPWGTVAFGASFVYFGELMVGRYIPLLIREPLLIIAFSYFLALIVGFVPVRADRRTSGAVETLPAEPEAAPAD